MSDDWDKVYPDTEDGARDALDAMSSITKADIDEAHMQPDPHVAGVWKLTWDEPVDGYITAAIVYLKGYKEPSGQVREANDFEVEEGDELNYDLDRMQGIHRSNEW